MNRPIHFYFLVLIITTLVVIALLQACSTPGLVMLGTISREDEVAAEAMEIDAQQHEAAGLRAGGGTGRELPAPSLRHQDDDHLSGEPYLCGNR